MTGPGPAPVPPHAASMGIVAITPGDIPNATGNPDQGVAGLRFVDYDLYDGLVLWDLSRSDTSSDIKPALATAWKVDPRRCSPAR
jgi:peptide/nickel transport system substrate-binding protein